jgi:hypothetical protein
MALIRRFPAVALALALACAVAFCAWQRSAHGSPCLSLQSPASIGRSIVLGSGCVLELAGPAAQVKRSLSISGPAFSTGARRRSLLWGAPRGLGEGPGFATGRFGPGG